MFERAIRIDAGTPATAQHCFELLDRTLGRSADIAAREGVSALLSTLTEAYAGAHPVARRRIDALLREAELIAAMGLGAVAARDARPPQGSQGAVAALDKALQDIARRIRSTLSPAIA
ncbi:MAG: hypothetical protein ACOY5R_15940 [Pseudomonadota bacterium]|uniref:hypothetical protein n=1 Tax=Rhizorhabdus phycosphaerae TaxID=2711156 RepID=UPI0013EB741C|nr:hypothetical protein [Rhizorhabdus phycosphaerae]